MPVEVMGTSKGTVETKEVPSAADAADTLRLLGDGRQLISNSHVDSAIVNAAIAAMTASPAAHQARQPSQANVATSSISMMRRSVEIPSSVDAEPAQAYPPSDAASSLRQKAGRIDPQQPFSQQGNQAESSNTEVAAPARATFLNFTSISLDCCFNRRAPSKNLKQLVPTFLEVAEGYRFRCLLIVFIGVIPSLSLYRVVKLVNKSKMLK